MLFDDAGKGVTASRPDRRWQGSEDEGSYSKRAKFLGKQGVLIDTTRCHESVRFEESVGTRLSKPANEEKEVCQCERSWMSSRQPGPVESPGAVKAVIQFTGGMS